MKITLIATIVLSIARFAFADEPPDTAWTLRSTYPVSGSCDLNASTINNQGYLYMAGDYYTSSGAAIFLIKANANTGDTIWKRLYQYPTEGYNYIATCSADSIGHVYLVGSRLNTNYDMLVMQLDADTGDSLWTRTYNGECDSNDFAFASSVDDSNNLFVVGHSVQQLDLYTKKPGIKILKIRPSNGDTIWTQFFWGNYGAFDCKYDTSGALFVMAEKDTTSGDVYIKKFNSHTGALIWARQYCWNVHFEGSTFDQGGYLYLSGRYQGVKTYKINGSSGDSIWGQWTPNPLLQDLDLGEQRDGDVDGSGHYYFAHRYDDAGVKMLQILKYDKTTGDVLYCKTYPGIGDKDYVSCRYYNGKVIVFYYSNSSYFEDEKSCRVLYADNATGDSLFMKKFTFSGGRFPKPHAGLFDNANMLYTLGKVANKVNLTKYNVLDRSVIWTKSYFDKVVVSYQGYLSRKLFFDKNNDIYVSGLGRRNTILSIDGASGDTIWSKVSTDHLWNGCTGDTLGYLYVTTNDNAIMKLSTNDGATTWSKNYSRSYADCMYQPYDVVGGYLNLIGDNNYLLKIYAENGDSIWSHPIFGVTARISTFDRNNNIYIVGGNWTLIKIDPVWGDTVWMRSYIGGGNYSSPYAYSCAVDDSNNIYVAGRIKEETNNKFSMLLIKYDPTGNTRWVTYYDGPENGNDYAYGIDMDNQNNLYLTGLTFSNGGYDIVTIKYGNVPPGVSVPLYTANVPNSFALLSPKPNPFSKQVELKYQLPVKNRVAIKVYNINGQLVRTLIDRELNSGYYTAIWDGHNQNGQKVVAGVYVCQLVAGSFSTTRKIVLCK